MTITKTDVKIIKRIGQPMPLKYLLAVFYPSNKYDNDLVDRFIFDFILEDKELPLFTINGSSPSPSLYLEPYRLGRLSH